MFIWPYPSFETKKSFMVGVVVKSDFSVSLCPFSETFGHTDTEMDTELDNLKKDLGTEQILIHQHCVMDERHCPSIHYFGT